MDKLTALLNMKNSLCEALRADLESALATIDRLERSNQLLREELRTKDRPWWADLDKDTEYQDEYGPGLKYGDEMRSGEAGTDLTGKIRLDLSRTLSKIPEKDDK